MKETILSVIIPVFNDGNKLGPIVKKVLSQKTSGLELFLIDDASQDASWGVIQQLAASDKRIRAIRQKKNSGAGEARNVGIKLARGKYLLFLDADDDIDTKMIPEMVKKMESGVDLSVCGMRFVWKKTGKVEDVWINKALEQGGIETIENYAVRLLGEDGRLYSSTNKIFRTSIIKKNGLRFLPRDFGEDTLFVLSYLKYINEKIVFIPEPYYIYNKGTETSTMGKSSLKYENWLRNYNDVKAWGGNNIDKTWLHWLKYRWTVSYLLAVKRSDLSFRKKRELYKAPKTQDRLPEIGALRQLGIKKWGIKILLKIIIFII